MGFLSRILNRVRHAPSPAARQWPWYFRFKSVAGREYTSIGEIAKEELRRQASRFSESGRASLKKLPVGNARHQKGTMPRRLRFELVFLVLLQFSPAQDGPDDFETVAAEAVEFVVKDGRKIAVTDDQLDFVADFEVL